MRLALVLLIGLAALTDATPLEAHSTTTEKTSNSGNNITKNIDLDHGNLA